jgi:hypothetical protein
MSRKRCNRRRWDLVNPITHVLQGIAVTPEDKLAKLRLLELSALESFRTGRATPDDWRALADVCNLAETLSLDGIGVEVLEASRIAQEALGHAHERYNAQGRLGITGQELQALRDIVEFHDLQRTSIGLAVYEAAIRKTRDRIRSAHPSVKTCIT